MAVAVTVSAPAQACVATGLKVEPSKPTQCRQHEAGNTSGKKQWETMG